MDAVENKNVLNDEELEKVSGGVLLITKEK